MNDEDVIRRRLLIDGDGTGDERRLNALLKSFVKWCNAYDEPESESRQAHDRMLSHLSQCEFAVAKSRVTASMSAAELDNYENMSKKIEKDILSTKQDIEKKKVELRNARTVRRNRIEYDLLAKVINEQPDRLKTNEELATLKNDMKVLQASREQLEKKMDHRRKEFFVMLCAIHQLQCLLDEGGVDEMMDISLDEVDVDKVKSPST